jgi:hypothetical protein
MYLVYIAAFILPYFYGFGIAVTTTDVESVESSVIILLYCDEKVVVFGVTDNDNCPRTLSISVGLKEVNSTIPLV